MDRIAATDAAAIFERLAATDLIERGCVVVISVDAIRDRAADRWPRRRDDVWTYVERKLNEHLSYHDVHQRVTETDFLVAMTSEDAAAAQAICMRILEEVLVHFVGEANKSDVKIRAVGAVRDGELCCTDLDPYRIEAVSKQTPVSYQQDVDPEEAKRRNPVSFVVASGQQVRIDFSLEPIVSLRHQVTAAVRVRPSVSYAGTGTSIPSRLFAKLADEDIAYIDRATQDYGALFLAKESASRPALILPASFRTLASRKGRAGLATLKDVTPQQMKRGAIIEFIDVDRGTPQGRLAEVTGLVGQLSRAVMVRLQPARDALATVRGTRIQGLTIDMAELELPEAQLIALMKAMALQMRGQAPTLMAQGLPARTHLTAAWEAGFTHAGVRTKPATSGPKPAPRTSRKPTSNEVFI